MGCIVPFLAIKSQGFRALEINYFFQKDCLLQIENLSFQKIVSALSFKNQEFDTLLLCAPPPPEPEHSASCLDLVGKELRRQG